MATIEEFGQKIKEKYPTYSGVDNAELGRRFLARYPEYSNRVTDTSATQPKATEGVLDAIKVGGQNIKNTIDKKAEELTKVMETPDSSPMQFLKTAKVAGTLATGIAQAGIAEPIATAGRVAGELYQNATGQDVNEATAKAVGELVQKGIDTPVAQKAVEYWNKAKATSPESGLALSTLGDIGEMLSYAVGAKGATKAKTAVGEGVASVGETVGEGVGKAKNAVLQALPDGSGGKVGEQVGKVAEGTFARAYGLEPSDVKNIIKNPEYFTPAEMEKVTRESVFNKVLTAVNKRLDDISETGKGYQAIRESTSGVNFKEAPYISILNKYGIGIGQDGKLILSAESHPMGAGDIAGIENFIKQYGSTNLSGNAFLNARKALSNLSRYDQSTDFAKMVSRELRSAYDAEGKKMIPGLADLDAKYAPEIQLMNKVKNIIFEKDGKTIKNNALTTIANLTGNGKEQILKRVEKIVPGITRDVNILKTILSIQRAEGNKVGTYSRALLAGGVGFMAGPLGAIVGMIATSPQAGIAILRAWAKYKGGIQNKVKGIIQKAEAGKPLTKAEGTIVNDAMEHAAQKVAKRKPVAKETPVAVNEVASVEKKFAQPKIEDVSKFERAKDLSPKEAKLEEKAFEFITKNEDKIVKAYIKEKGKIVNTDDFRKVFKKLGYNGANSATFQEPASYLSKRVRAQLMENEGDTFLAYAGGSGTGKTSAVKGIPAVKGLLDNASGVLDGNLSSLSSAEKLIQQAIEAGKVPQFIYVYRSPIESLVEGVVKRMRRNIDEMGRIVPSKVVAGNHIDSWAVIKELHKNGYDVQFVDNSLGLGNQKLTTFEELSKKIKYPSKEKLTQQFNQELKKLYGLGKAKGGITKAEYLKYIE